MPTDKQEPRLDTTEGHSPAAPGTQSYSTPTTLPDGSNPAPKQENPLQEEDNTPTQPRLRTQRKQTTGKRSKIEPPAVSPGSQVWIDNQLPTGLLDEDEAPPSRWFKLSRPMPALKYKQEQGSEKLPATPEKNIAPTSPQPEETLAPAPMPILGGLELPPPDRTSVATPKKLEVTPQVFAKRPQGHSRPQHLRLLISVILLALIVLTGGSFTLMHLLAGSTANPLDTTNDPNTFAQTSLNAQQIDELHHLSTRMSAKQLAGLYVARMSLDEEIGQIIMVEYDDTYYSDDLNRMLTELHAGGVIMYEFQMLTATQTKGDISSMQQHAKLPLLISTDEEGGIVHRLTNIYPPRPSALDIYNTGDPQVAAQQGHKVAQDLLALGINTNLAPSVDVALVQGPGQATRTFGYTADSVINFAGPYIKSMQQDGVIACIKHFPGMGAAEIDPHKGLPVVNRTKEQLYQTELAPFKHFIQTKDKLENPGMVMPTDILMPAIDPVYPAELSHTFMTDILRKELGYDGMTLTDALYMQGVTINGQPISMAQAGVMALQAGNDMLLGPTGYVQTLNMVNAIKAALQDGTLSRARLDEAATRVIALKMQRHLMPAVPPQN
ncbi:hypothetical protein KSD_25350 [Ktedonobacter sp. SOSP1-85]|uniref:glycoside hydrolase family 3 N-terminal domain-containing protein n=1 Tax=Ktedonobacter sp. SOSP1-85 TaxID=2778367 RepID=UPI00191583B9|nr:glycoside hydrolase family 3 N-terminal domain-containing protein [Ktedonobacter sp. SOSP1-85]GHO74764.1 hypothetical protein KSD_25350 [Ktedonobacter sp. SOSP1-85]